MRRKGIIVAFETWEGRKYYACKNEVEDIVEDVVKLGNEIDWVRARVLVAAEHFSENVVPEHAITALEKCGADYILVRRDGAVDIVDNRITFAVYGTLRCGCYNYRKYMKDQVYIGTGIVHGYKMYRKKGVIYPFVVAGYGKIVVDVFKVEHLVCEEIASLERKYGYKEENVIVQLSNGKAVKAKMFVLGDAKWEQIKKEKKLGYIELERIIDGDWVKYAMERWGGC